MEGASTTVYAQGGRGNARLVAWDGERTVTFTMEDALISAEGLAILAAAKLLDPALRPHHVTETVDIQDITVAADSLVIKLSETPITQEIAKEKKYGKNMAYVMLVKDGEIISEPFIVQEYDGKSITVSAGENFESANEEYYVATNSTSEPQDKNGRTIAIGDDKSAKYTASKAMDFSVDGLFDSVIVDYYTEKMTKEIQITPDMFGGNFYLEAETLFRNQNGEDLPAVFTIPNCKIQSNFTLSMAASGDPSTFTFTLDAFPDYTYFDHSQKVFADIQVIEDAAGADAYRQGTNEYWNRD